MWTKGPGQQGDQFDSVSFHRRPLGLFEYLIAVLLLLLGPTSPDPAAAKSRRDDAVEQTFVSSKIRDRLTKAFDFDERAIGNYESMPAGWRQLNAVRYPRFLEPKFDMKVGHDAPPSFKLPLTGAVLPVTTSPATSASIRSATMKSPDGSSPRSCAVLAHSLKSIFSIMLLTRSTRASAARWTCMVRATTSPGRR